MRKQDLNLTSEDEIRSQIIKARLELKMRRAKNTNIVKNLQKSLARILTAKSNAKP